MIETAALVIVLFAALFLFGLAVISWFAPSSAVRFLGAFANSARAHYLEMLVRLVVGLAFVARAPRMLYPNAFSLFGWALVVSTVILLLLPWRWHQRFGQKFVPSVIRHVWLFGVVSLPLGGVIAFAALYGIA